MSLKVLMICPEFIPKMGGAEIQAFNLSKTLQSKGVDVRVLTRLSDKSWKKEEVLEGIPVQRVDYPRIRLIGGVLLNTCLAWNILTRYRDFDVFHFHIGGNHMVLPLLFLKIVKKPVVLKVSGWWELERGFLSNRGSIPWILRMVFFRSDAIIALSDEIKKQLSYFGFPRQRIVSLPNGVNTQHFAPISHDNDCCRVVFVGRMVTEKGVPVLLQAVAKLQAEFPGLSLDLVGDGYEMDTLRAMTGELGLQDTVNFLGRMNDVTSVLKRAEDRKSVV